MSDLQTITATIVILFLMGGVFFLEYDKNNKECIPYRNDQQQFNQYTL